VRRGVVTPRTPTRTIAETPHVSASSATSTSQFAHSPSAKRRRLDMSISGDAGTMRSPTLTSPSQSAPVMSSEIDDDAAPVDADHDDAQYARTDDDDYAFFVLGIDNSTSAPAAAAAAIAPSTTQRKRKLAEEAEIGTATQVCVCTRHVSTRL
jgi:hypothetical protein